MQFVDEVKVSLKSGDGGRGCTSYRREKFIPRGEPDGGSGGNGGDVIIQTSPSVSTLVNYRYQQHFKAKNGSPGSSKNKHGASASALVISVPLGTEILSDDQQTILMDLSNLSDRHILLKGGKGGVGNGVCRTATDKDIVQGEIGQQIWVRMRLKLLADVGIIGLPNAGKSTLLSAITSARPKIADYPFTTLTPNLGVVRVGYEEFVVADIPGLIEHASEGVGLGHRFLQHVERCKLLLHMIDIRGDICTNYTIIRKELQSYNDTLHDKPEIIVLNKSDELSEEEIKEKCDLIYEHTGIHPYVISAATRDNTKHLANKLLEEVANQ